MPNSNIKLRWGSIINDQSIFEGQNIIGKKSIFTGKIGYASFIGNNCNISAEIGRYTSIGHNVETIQATHPIKTFVSTHPVFYSLLNQAGTTFTKTQRFNEFRYANAEKKYGVIIGNDVWIGNGVTLIGGITIGDGTVILANATVTRDISPYQIVGGIPAKKIDQRFDDSTINYLLSIAWWNLSTSQLRKNVDLFANIDNFVNKFKPDK